MSQWLKAGPKCVDLSCIPRTCMFEGEKTLTNCLLTFANMHVHTPHTHKHKKNKYFLTIITHVCLQSSLSLISEKLMLGWQNKRQEGKWITTQDVKSLVVRLDESKGWKSTILSLHFHHFCKRSYNLPSASSISVPWLYPTPYSLWALVTSISGFDHVNILCRLQPRSFSF